MVDTARIRFSDDLTSTNVLDGSFPLESYAHEAIDRIKLYAREEPIKFALWAFGIGFVLGWRLKPW